MRQLHTEGMSSVSSRGNTRWPKRWRFIHVVQLRTRSTHERRKCVDETPRRHSTTDSWRRWRWRFGICTHVCIQWRRWLRHLKMFSIFIFLFGICFIHSLFGDEWRVRPCNMHFVSAIGATHFDGRRRSALTDLLSQEMISASFSMVNVVRRKSLFYMRATERWSRKVECHDIDSFDVRYGFSLCIFRNMKRCECVVPKLRKSNRFDLLNIFHIYFRPFRGILMTIVWLTIEPT